MAEIEVGIASFEIGREKNDSKNDMQRFLSPNTEKSVSKDVTNLNSNPVAESISNPYYISIFLFLNAMIGSGIFNQPYVFLQSGVLGALLIYIPACYFTWLGVVTLTEACLVADIPEFEGVARFALGRWGEWWVNSSLLLYLFGGELSYFLLLGQILTELFVSWGCKSEICSQYMTTFVAAVLVILPIASMRHFGNMGYLSVYSMLTMVLCIGLVLIGGPVIASASSASESLVMINGPGMLVSGLGSIVFALGCAPNTMHIYLSSRPSERTPQTWSLITMGAIGAGLIMLLTMGLAGYFSFRNDTNPFILENFPQQWAQLFFLLVVIHLVLFIPGDLMILRYNFSKVFFGKRAEDLSPIVNHSVTTFILLCILGTVMGIINATDSNSSIAFSIVLNITGGVAASSISFILPSVLYLTIVPQHKQTYRMVSIANAAFGIAITGAVIATQIAVPFVPLLRQYE